MRIGKLAEATGATTATLRYYEDEGLLRAELRAEEDVDEPLGEDDGGA